MGIPIMVIEIPNIYSNKTSTNEVMMAMVVKHSCTIPNFSVIMWVSINGDTPKWMVYDRTCHSIG